MREKILALANQLGLKDVAFVTANAEKDLKYAISAVVPLSPYVVQEIDTAPTHSYFHHYRTINAYIDQCQLRLGMLLQENGYLYLPIPGSQSINTPDKYFEGRCSHKMIACMAGLGYIGKSNLFISYKYGPAVRLFTLFTDCDQLAADPITPTDHCGDCTVCRDACPAGAIKGVNWCDANDRLDMFDPQKCSDYMKSAFKMIGRGAVCGICMAKCPQFLKHRKEKQTP